jgi:hypothetical protein
VQFHHGVVVDVHHVRRRHDLLDHLVGVADRRQPGTDVDELPHAVPRYPLGRALVEAAVGPGRVPDLGRGLEDLLGGETVNLEIVIALQHVVVDPGRGRPACVDASRNLGNLVHGRLPREQLIHSLARLVRITNTDIEFSVFAQIMTDQRDCGAAQEPGRP